MTKKEARRVRPGLFLKPLKRKWWAGLGSNQRRRKPEDLQSSPFNHSGTYPFTFVRAWI
jgi:hypothetical protein